MSAQSWIISCIWQVGIRGRGNGVDTSPERGIPPIHRSSPSGQSPGTLDRQRKLISKASTAAPNAKSALDRAFCSAQLSLRIIARHHRHLRRKPQVSNAARLELGSGFGRRNLIRPRSPAIDASARHFFRQITAAAQLSSETITQGERRVRTSTPLDPSLAADTLKSLSPSSHRRIAVP